MGRVNQWLIDQGEQPEVDWTRLKAQQDFITTKAPFAMFSGGFGTGKTSALTGRVIALMTLIPGNLGYLARQDGKALKQTTMLDLLDKIPKDWIQSHDAQKGMLRLHPEVGGSILIYGDLKDLGDLKNHNLGFFAMDQTEETEWQAWEFLVGRLRRKNPVIDADSGMRQYWVTGNCTATNLRHFAVGTQQKHCALCAQVLPGFSEKMDPETRLPTWDLMIYPRFGFGVCNTEDPSHWIYQKFSGLPGQESILSQGIEGYQAYHATTYEGLAAGFIDNDYVTNLETTYAGNKLMYDRYLLGLWVVAEGLVFPGFKKDIHIIHEDQLRYDGQPLLRTHSPVHEYIDPGITATTAVGWVVVEHCDCGCGRPVFYLIDEHYVASELPEYHCSQIKLHREEIGRHVVSTEMDAQAFSRSNIQKVTESNASRLYSVAQLYIEEGIYVRRNQKDWESGYARLSQALAIDPNHVHPITGEKGAPHFYVLSRCQWFVDELRKYKWKKRKDETRGKEEPADRDDHHMDGIVSFMAGRPEHRVVDPDPPETRSKWQLELEEELDMLTGVGAYDFMEM